LVVGHRGLQAGVDGLGRSLAELDEADGPIGGGAGEGGGQAAQIEQPPLQRRQLAQQALGGIVEVVAQAGGREGHLLHPLHPIALTGAHDRFLSSRSQGSVETSPARMA
jgi:hypothetical protein